MRDGAACPSWPSIRCRAMIRFAEPQDIMEMATFSSTQIATEFFHISVGGDPTPFKDMMKVLFERDAIDHDFVRDNTVGIEALRGEIA
jgi:formate dehydrogenase major subunit